MFCSHCGAELNAGDAFCYNCGKQNRKRENGGGQPKRANSNSQLATTSGTQELNREALSIYLQDVLSLELAKMKLEDNYRVDSHQLNTFVEGRFTRTYTILPEQREYWAGNAADHRFFHLMYDAEGKRFCIAVWPLKYGDAPVTKQHFSTTATYYDKHMEWLSFTGCEDQILNYKFWMNDEVIPKGLPRINRQLQAKEVCKLFEECYNDFKSKVNDIVRSDRQIIANLKDAPKRYQSNYARVNALLEKSYSMNILPSQYRNVYAVYYLWDFLKTSSESFSSALFHLDLHNIERKLDTIISQQRDIILSQQQLLSANSRLVSQNQEKLKRLAQIEHNTAQSALYSEIAANNAEACALFSLANLIQNRHR